MLSAATLRRGRGRIIGDLSVAGPRLAWIELRDDGRRSVVQVVVARRRTGRTVRRTALHSGPSGERGALSVALTTRGELATAAGSGRETRLVLRAPGAPPREIARGPIGRLDVEDDATLRWHDVEGWNYLDLHDLGPGCPRRSQFRRVFSTPEVVVTEAEYTPYIDTVESVLRACLVASGQDPVIAQGEYTIDGGVLPRAVAANGTWVLVDTELSERGAGPCTGHTLTAIHLPDASPGRSLGYSGCPGVMTRLVTSLGAPVALTRESPANLVSRDASGTRITLDRGEIAGVRVEGEEVLWTNAGEPRRARP